MKTSTIYSGLNAESSSSAARIKAVHRDKEWQGACIGTGCPRTGIGLIQAKAYCRFVGCKFKPRKNLNQYRFGADVQKWIGSIAIRFQILNKGFVQIEVDVVKVDVPFLLRWDWIDKLNLCLDKTKNVLISSPENISIRAVRKFGHVYLECKIEKSILFSRSELLKIHRGFRHPTDTKILNLIKKARPNEASKATAKLLKEITRSCNTCWRLGSQPNRFTNTLPTLPEVKFGDEVSLDLMFIEG